MKRAVAIAVLAGGFISVAVAACWAGAIQGEVTLAGGAPPPRKVPVTIDQYVCGDAKMAEDLQVSARNGVRNVVVWIDNPPASAKAASPAEAGTGAVEMDQKECVFTPRIVLVPAGGTVHFLNSDRLLHNLHARPKLNGAFNRAQPKGRTISIDFAQPEIFRVDCDLHAWMRSWVVVTAHPFYTVTDAEGRFTLDNLPAGRYTLRLWHETLGTASREVTVPASGAAQTTIEMARPPSR